MFEKRAPKIRLFRGTVRVRRHCRAEVRARDSWLRTYVMAVGCSSIATSKMETRPKRVQMVGRRNSDGPGHVVNCTGGKKWRTRNVAVRLSTKTPPVVPRIRVRLWPGLGQEAARNVTLESAGPVFADNNS